jgi:CRP-like cAMP-binding protein
MAQDSSSQNSSQSSSQSENQFLAALPTEVYQRLSLYLETVSLAIRDILHVPNEPIEYVYFPTQALISLVNVLEDGSMIELSLASKKGMVGIQAFLGNSTMPYQAICQVAGNSLRIPVAPFQAECNRKEALQDLLLRYTRFFLIETAQGTACNGAHSLEERLARWLLTVSDRLEFNELPLTQEFIAQMLGVRRPGVTIAAGILQQAGIIRYRRGEITILSRENLEATACECYQVVKTEMNRWLS